MITSNDGALVVMPPVVTATNTTTAMSFSKLSADGQPFDHAVIDIILQTHATNVAGIRQLFVAEHDSTTSATSMTKIAALSSSLATNATYSNALPVATNQAKGGIIELQIDLRKRKKYIGIGINSSTVTAFVSAVARLTRGKTSKDTAALKNKTGATFGNLAATNAQGCLACIVG